MKVQLGGRIYSSERVAPDELVAIFGAGVTYESRYFWAG